MRQETGDRRQETGVRSQESGFDSYITSGITDRRPDLSAVALAKAEGRRLQT
jgi:hypothetical protein